MNYEPLRLQIEKQITGFCNHLRNIQTPHRIVETNTRRAMGHAQEAIRLSMKLRRLYTANAPAEARRSRSLGPEVGTSEEGKQ